MTLYDNLKKIYGEKTYTEKYGGSIFLTSLALGVALYFGIRSLFYNKVNNLRVNWEKEKCNPLYMPMAGYIDPNNNSSKIQAAASNFNVCSGNLLTNIVGEALSPANYAAEMIVRTLKYLAKTINRVRMMMNYTRNKLTDVTRNIMNRIINIVIPLSSIITNIKTIFYKTAGVLTTALYTAIGMIMAVKAALGAFITLLIITLVILAAAIGVLWILPFTWWIAIPMTAFYIFIAVLAGITLYWTVYITKRVQSNSIPPNPCFDKNTIIRTKYGKKKIKDIYVNDILEDGSIVTGIIKSSIQGGVMYKYNDILVTGEHFVQRNGEWIKIKDHPDSKREYLYKDSYVYCLNTNKKTIKIGNDIFLDWDDIDDIEHQTDNIHKYLDGGFMSDTLIELQNNKQKEIKDINIGDILKDGAVVLGTVCIDGQNTSGIQQYVLNKTIIRGGPNLQITDKYLGKFSTLDIDGQNIPSPEKLYHLITDSKTMMIGNICFRDYNGAMEVFYGEIF